MSIGWTFKVLRIILALASRISQLPDVASIAGRLREERQGTLYIYDDYGNSLTVCITVGREGVRVSSGECSRPNNRVSMHINTLLDLLEGRVDFRTAVAHGAIAIESLDGRPWFYHFILWSQVYSLLQRGATG